MQNKIICFFVYTLIIFISTLTADTTYVSGHIETSITWTTDHSPYIITDDVYVDFPCTLRIEPGVDVLFHRPGDIHSIIVNGYLLAEGTGMDSITFSVDTLINPDSRQWHSITFMNSSDSISILKYCKIEYGYWNVICGNGSQKILNNRFNIQRLTGTVLVGVYCWNNSKPFISKNSFTGCTGIALALEDNTSAQIKRNNINVIGSGMQMSDATSAIIDSNKFRGCFEGISIFNSSPTSDIKIRWNVFENISSMAIRVYYSPANVTIVNNDIYKSRQLGLSIWGEGTNYSKSFSNILEKNGIDSMEYYGAYTVDLRVDTTIIKHNLFNRNFNDFPRYTPPGVKEIVTTNINGDSCDTFFNIFGYDPLVDTMTFELSAGSPCINAGDPILPWDPDGTPPDIGAHYYDTSAFIEESVHNKPEKIEILCYPNPFNSTLSIIAPIGSNISIYDIKGRLVYTKYVDIQQKPHKKKEYDQNESIYVNSSTRTIRWIPDESVSSGIYLIRMNNNEFKRIGKAVYLK